MGKGRRGGSWVLELCNYITNWELGICFVGVIRDGGVGFVVLGF